MEALSARVKNYFTTSEVKFCSSCGKGTPRSLFWAWECKSCKGIKWVGEGGEPVQNGGVAEKRAREERDPRGAERRDEGSEQASGKRARVCAGKAPGEPGELRKGDRCWYKGAGGAKDQRVEIIQVDKAHADGLPSYLIKFQDGRERETEHYKLCRVSGEDAVSDDHEHAGPNQPEGL